MLNETETDVLRASSRVERSTRGGVGIRSTSPLRYAALSEQS